MSQGGTADVVARDDLLYGEPRTTPLGFGKAKLNKKRGTAKLQCLVPSDGKVALKKSKTLKKGRATRPRKRGA